MRYKDFLINEDREYNDARSKSISDDQAKKALLGNYNKSFKAAKTIHVKEVYRNKGTILYRGIPSQDDFRFTDPSEGSIRKSANTKNYYTTLVDNDPKWDYLPSRSAGIICSTSQNLTTHYGQPYMVFPINGARLGVVPDDDFWSAFSESGVYNMASFNRVITDIFREASIMIDDDDHTSMMRAFDNFDSYFTDADDFLEFWKDSRYFTNNAWLSDYANNMNMRKFISNLLDPRKNGFKVKKAGDQIKCENCEVWTDHRCILVKDIMANRELLGIWGNE